MLSVEPASAYFRSYAFRGFTDQSNSWGRTRVVYVPLYPDGIPEDASEPYYTANVIQVNGERNAFDGDRATWVEGKSVEPVWDEAGNLLCGRTGWLTLNLYQTRAINEVSLEYAAALANKAVTVQAYNYWTHSWRTIAQGVYDYNTPNLIHFRTVYTDKIRVRVETGENGPLPWSGTFSVHGAYIYEIQVGYRSG